MLQLGFQVVQEDINMWSTATNAQPLPQKTQPNAVAPFNPANI